MFVRARSRQKGTLAVNTICVTPNVRSVLSHCPCIQVNVAVLFESPDHPDTAKIVRDKKNPVRYRRNNSKTTREKLSLRELVDTFNESATDLCDA